MKVSLVNKMLNMISQSSEHKYHK